MKYFSRFTRERIVNFLKALVLPMVILASAWLIFIGVLGFSRFTADFWPLDNSRVGPNLVASVVTVLLVVAHNEFSVAERDEQHHVKTRDLIRDELATALHPVDKAEDNIADKVVDDEAGRTVQSGDSRKTPVPDVAGKDIKAPQGGGSRYANPPRAKDQEAPG